MRFVKLRVESFRAIELADIELGRGLNVLYGPNDQGKSTLAVALRAALLLPCSSSEGQSFVPWHKREASPRTMLVFEDDDDRRWRVKKKFGDENSAELEFTKDGVSFSPDSKSLAYLELYDVSARAWLLGVVAVVDGKPKRIGDRCPNYSWGANGNELLFLSRFLKPIYSVDLMLFRMGEEQATKVNPGVFGYGFTAGNGSAMIGSFS